MKLKTIRFIVQSCALLIACLALEGSAVAQSRYGNGITVYADVNYSGQSATFREDIPNLVSFGFNDAISSILIPDGEQWEICQDINYSNRCQVLMGSVPDLRTINWNDRISSMRRVSGGGRRFGGIFSRNSTNAAGVGTGMTVFVNPNFRGRSESFSSDVSDLRQYGLNDQITSIEVPNGETWEICQDINYEGPCQTVTGSIADLRSMGWNDRISSMRRTNNRSWRNRGYDNTGNNGGYENRYQQGLVFYDRPNFRGASTLVTSGSSTAGFSGRQGSVQVRDGGVWRICDQEGECATIDRDVSNLAELGLNGRITSVREVNSSWNRYRGPNRYRYYR